MNIYLAARYSRIDEMNGYAAQLRAAGHTVTARWLLGDHQSTDLYGPDATDYANDDISDLAAADTVICFTETPRSTSSRGGRHVEFGLALGLGKNVVIVGPPENVFCVLDYVWRFEEFAPVLDYIAGLEAADAAEPPARVANARPSLFIEDNEIEAAAAAIDMRVEWIGECDALGGRLSLYPGDPNAPTDAPPILRNVTPADAFYYLGGVLIGIQAAIFQAEQSGQLPIMPTAEIMGASKERPH